MRLLSYRQHLDLRKERNGWIEFIRGFDHAITLQTNSDTMGLDRARKLLEYWDARMNSAALGGSWQKPHNRHYRTTWIAFPEGLQPGLKIHWHLAFTHSPRCAGNTQAISLEVDKQWLMLVPAGTTRTKLFADDGWASYMTKMQRCNREHIVLAGQNS